MAGTYYIEEILTVVGDKTLTLSPGAVVKFGPDAKLKLIGSLAAIGTAGEKIEFTSFNDNTVGETITGSNGNPEPGDWANIKMHEPEITQEKRS